MYYIHFSAYCQIQEIPVILQDYGDFPMYARLDSNQRPSESELIKRTDVLVFLTEITLLTAERVCILLIHAI